MRSTGMEENPRRKAWRGGLGEEMDVAGFDQDAHGGAAFSPGIELRRPLDPVGGAADGRPGLALRQVAGEGVVQPASARGRLATAGA